MATFTAMLALGIGLSAGLRTHYAHKSEIHDLFPLQNATDAAAMVKALTQQNGGRWPSDCVAPPPGKAIAVDPAASATPAAQPEPAASAPTAPVATTACGNPGTAGSPAPVSVDLLPVRLLLAVDSLLIVPGYLGWFMLSLLFLLPRYPGERARVRSTSLDWHELLLQLCCLVPATGAAFDLAENGITVLGIEDAISYVLADDLVADMHVASTWKWWLFAASSALVSAGAAWAVIHARRRPATIAGAEPAPEGGAAAAGLASRWLVVATLLGPVNVVLLSGNAWSAPAALAAMSLAAVQWLCVGVALSRQRFAPARVAERDEPGSRADGT